MPVTKATWWAANYAKHAGLTLQIVCAYSLPSYAAVSFDATYTAMGDDNAAHSDAQEILSKAKAIADEQGVEAATLIVTGDPASVFVELSRNYNLIVIGNRGKGGLAERLLGTTSSSLPAYAYCPIVVVPYTDDDGNLMHLNNTITKVAVGSDESKWGLKAGHCRRLRHVLGCGTGRDFRCAEPEGRGWRGRHHGVLQGRS